MRSACTFMNAGPYLSWPIIFVGRRDETRAGVVGLFADRAIELRRVADRFVNRQPQVRRLENEVRTVPASTALRCQLLGRQRGPALGIARHVQRLDVLPAGAARRELFLVDLEITRARRPSPRSPGRRESIVCVTFVPSDVTSVLTSRSSARPGIDEAHVLAPSGRLRWRASRSATFSSSGTSSGSRLTGVIQVPWTGATGASSTRRR